MKKLLSVITTVVFTATLLAQAPQKMSYQAVIRDGANALVANQNVGMQISILQGSVSGAAVYIETQTAATNDNGLVSLEIGSGNVVSGDFSTIDWSTGSYYIKTETDLTGGSNYTISGTAQLLSVPYAMYAEESGNGGNLSPWVKTGTDIYYDSGTVGIGTTTPDNDYALDVDGSIKMGDTLQLTGGRIKSGLALIFPYMEIKSFMLTLDAAGVIPGNNNPNPTVLGTQDARWGEFSGTSSNLEKESSLGNPQLKLVDQSPDGYARMQFADTMGSEFWTINANSYATGGYMNFGFSQDGISENRVLTLSSIGKVGIGINVPKTELHVVHQGGGSGANLVGFTIENREYPANSTSINMAVGSNSNSLYFYNAAGVNIGTFDGTSGNYTSSSDARLKTNIQNMPSALSKVMLLQAKSYNYKGQKTDRTYLGFIAQDVEKIFPSLVYNPNDSQDGKEENYTVNYSGFGVIAIQAIQEQQKMIKTLQQQVDALKARLDAIDK